MWKERRWSATEQEETKIMCNKMTKESYRRGIMVVGGV